MSASFEDVTLQQGKFITFFLKDPESNPERAAVAAKYSPKTALVQAKRLLRNPKIQAVIASVRSQAEAVAVFGAAEVLRELVPLASSNIVNYLDSNGHLVSNLSKLPLIHTKAVKSLKQTKAIDGAVTTEIQLWSKLEALNLAGKHVDVGAYLERLEVSSDLSALLDQRLAGQVIEAEASADQGEEMELVEVDSSLNDDESFESSQKS